MRAIRYVLMAVTCGLLLACGGGEPTATRTEMPARARLAAPATAASLAGFFNWAQAAYPQFFNGASDDGTLDVAGYGTFTYRHFASGNYVAVLDGSVYAYGWVTGYAIQRIGALNDFLCSAYPGNVGCTSLTVGGLRASALESMDDTGFYPIYLHAGLEYVFAVSSTAFDTYLGLYHPSGAFVKANNDIPPGTDSVVAFAPSVSGLYSLRVNSASGFGSYTLNTYYSTTTVSNPRFISWPNNVAHAAVTDSTRGDTFAFDAATRCLYSFNRNDTVRDFCLDAGSSSGTYLGQAFQVILVNAGPGRCVAALADPAGVQINVDTTTFIPGIARTAYQWDTAGCG